MATTPDGFVTTRAWPRLQWGPVIAGVLVTLAIELVLGLFGSALGISALAGFSVGEALVASVWGLVAPLVAVLLGAYVAVRMTNDRTPSSAYLNGILVWCLSLLVGAIVLATTFAGLLGLAMTPGRTGLAQAIAPTLMVAGAASVLAFIGSIVGTALARSRMTTAHVTRQPIARPVESSEPLMPPTIVPPRQAPGETPDHWH